jgi:hypothetical protein
VTAEKVPAKMKPIYDAIITLTDSVCKEHLNQECADLSRQMAAALCRKRPSPLVNGKAKTWAAGIVYALGQMNFLFDKSQTPYISPGDLCKLFDVSQQSAGARAKQIRDLLNMHRFDHTWMLPSRMEDNPLIWMLSVNGFIVDIRHMPRGAQEEAYRKGLIPYIPDDQP